ncbi:MAG TPA: metal-dependent hydrolase [Psychromonas hadalis]|nr:metal-dependent hydrolase [Psychromonas hadalis]
MDSLSQIALGATLAAAVGIKPFGRKVLIAGAILGGLPDLDILINYGSAVDNYTSHRGFTHSLLVLIPFSVFLFFIALKIKATFNAHNFPLFLVIVLALTTHPLLDSFTTYGTQIFWALPYQPIAFHSIFIIDPLYTVPVIITMLGLWVSNVSPRWQKLNRGALMLSCCYLIFGFFAQKRIKDRVLIDPITNNAKVMIFPPPFNTIFWRALVYTGDHYYETFTQLASDKSLKWQRYSTNRELIKEAQLTELEGLEWFTGGHIGFSI